MSNRRKIPEVAVETLRSDVGGLLGSYEHGMLMNESTGQAEFLRLFLDAEADVYRYVCALAPKPTDARDIVQETALALWENFDRYDRSRPFLPWALRFALNKVRQHAEKNSKVPLLMGDPSLLDLLWQDQEQMLALSGERTARLRRCLDELSEDHAELLRGYYWQRMTVEQLAARGKSTTEAVYKRLQRIRAALLNCINRFDQTEARS